MMNMCYCYKDECNQKEWENQGKTGKRQYIVVSSLYIKGWNKIPKCPYCKQKMTVTANLDDIS